MIKALIVDDEAHARNDIAEKLQQFFNKEIEIVHQSDSVCSGLSDIKKYKPDLLFLDIHLSDGTGFDLVSQSDYSFDIIFVTAHNDEAIKAIKVGALDYVLKPVDEKEFKEAVYKAIESNSKKKEIHLEKLIEISNEYLKGVAKKRVVLKTQDTVYAVYEEDIIYCHADGNYTTFYTQQKDEILVSKSIGYFEDILSSDIFIRCHNSYLVNKAQVLKYNKKEEFLITTLDYKIPVSFRRKDFVFKKIFG